MKSLTVTRTIESAASVEQLFPLLAAAENIPQWAPLFADAAMLQSDGSYLVRKNNDTFTMQSISNQAAGTVDYLRALSGDTLGGAYLRIVPIHRGGSVVVMTVPVAPDKSAEEVGTILSQELAQFLEFAERNSRA